MVGRRDPGRNHNREKWERESSRKEKAGEFFRMGLMAVSLGFAISAKRGFNRARPRPLVLRIIFLR